MTRSRLVLPARLVATFLGFLDLMIVMVALPRIRTDLGASPLTAGVRPAGLAVPVVVVGAGQGWLCRR
jgi:hypothetical protein